MLSLEQIQREAKNRKKEFTQLLKRANKQHIIRKLPEWHDEVFKQIDCLQCANCCKNYSPRFRLPDIKRIAKHLGMKDTEFIAEYLRVDEDEDYVLKASPCAFLQADNTCSIYDVRPRDCYRYPYTDEDVLVKQIGLSIKNAAVCPAVYVMLDKMSNINF